ncbi:MAG: HAD-IIIA family hydrolase [Planctomycetota bacterium]
MLRPAVFLDRDDTLIVNSDLPAPPPPANPGDIISPDDVRPLPGAVEACAQLRDAGYALVVITNQGVVARGGIDIDALGAIHERLHDVFTDAHGSRLLDAIYACPYHPRGSVEPFAREHPWRKPAPGMILAAADTLSIDLARSWLVGDAARDIDAGMAAGISPDRCLRVGPDGEMPTVAEAAAHIKSATS